MYLSKTVRQSITECIEAFEVGAHLQSFPCHEQSDCTPFLMFARMSPKDDESRYSALHQTHESPTSRDPFALQPHSKSQQSTSTVGQAERQWQSYAQYQHSPASSFASRSTCPPSGSISQGSPMPSASSIRSSTEPPQFPSATNNQLINPRYPYYLSKSKSTAVAGRLSSFCLSSRTDDQPNPLSRQSSSPPNEYHPTADNVTRPAHQVRTSSRTCTESRSLLYHSCISQWSVLL